jgi:hypothetical protein
MKFGRMSIWAFALLALVSTICKGETSEEAKVHARAQRFFDDYNRAILSRNGGFDESVEWVTKNPLVTPEYTRCPNARKQT